MNPLIPLLAAKIEFCEGKLSGGNQAEDGEGEYEEEEEDFEVDFYDEDEEQSFVRFLSPLYSLRFIRGCGQLPLLILLGVG